MFQEKGYRGAIVFFTVSPAINPTHTSALPQLYPILSHFSSQLLFCPSSFSLSDGCSPFNPLILSPSNGCNPFSHISSFNGMNFEDIFGMKNREYVSFACDDLPLLCGRSPMQVYQDFMRSFTENFVELLETTITDIEISMGPDGELWYPVSGRKMDKTVFSMGVVGVGDLFIHDKHMLKYVPEFERMFALDGFRSTQFYDDIIISHGDKLLQIASDLFSRTSLNLTVRLAAVHFKFPSREWCEMMAGYENMRGIIQMIKKHKFGVCIPGFDLSEGDLKTESAMRHTMWMRELIAAAAEFEVPIVGENVLGGYHKPHFEEILKMCKVCKDCSMKPLVFNFVAERDFDLSWEKVGFAEFMKTMADIVET